jgi:hypothetical protein
MSAHAIDLVQWISAMVTSASDLTRRALNLRSAWPSASAVMGAPQVIPWPLPRSDVVPLHTKEKGRLSESRSSAYIRIFLPVGETGYPFLSKVSFPAWTSNKWYRGAILIGCRSCISIHSFVRSTGSFEMLCVAHPAKCTQTIDKKIVLPNLSVSPSKISAYIPTVETTAY